MEYRCVATSVEGFVQQLASCYLPHGSWLYVSGIIPPGKEPESVDEKLIAKYGIGVSRTSRARRKAVGIANIHYLRYQRRFLLLATHGFHPFYDDEAKSIRDVRRVPVKFEGYSISVAKGGYRRKEPGNGAAVPDDKWRVRVQIERELYKGLKAYLIDVAPHRERTSPVRRCPWTFAVLHSGISVSPPSASGWHPRSSRLPRSSWLSSVRPFVS